MTYTCRETKALIGQPRLGECVVSGLCPEGGEEGFGSSSAKMTLQPTVSILESTDFLSIKKLIHIQFFLTISKT